MVPLGIFRASKNRNSSTSPRSAGRRRSRSTHLAQSRRAGAQAGERVTSRPLLAVSLQLQSPRFAVRGADLSFVYKLFQDFTVAGRRPPFLRAKRAIFVSKLAPSVVQPDDALETTLLASLESLALIWPHKRRPMVRGEITEVRRRVRDLKSVELRLDDVESLAAAGFNSQLVPRTISCDAVPVDPRVQRPARPALKLYFAHVSDRGVDEYRTTAKHRATFAAHHLARLAW